VANNKDKNGKFDEYTQIIEETVKFHEVDLLGVCNNAVYFNYFEDARIAYLKELKKQFNFRHFLVDNSFFIMVRNECNYMKSAHLDDKLKIFTKIDFVKTSSFGFKHLVYRESTDEVIAEGKGVVVHIDKENQKAQPLPDEFYEAVLNFEKEVNILRK